MESADTNLVNKCENLMNIVVESRKRFGKMCIDYEKKTKVMENKLLNLKIETFSNYKFKPKNPVTQTEDDSDEMEAFKAELLELCKRREGLMKKAKNTQEVVAQIKADSIGKRLREPLTAEVLFAKALAKNV